MHAQIILLSNQGHIASEIAQALDMCEKTLQVWINRCNRAGVAGLEEKIRSGRLPVYSIKDSLNRICFSPNPTSIIGLAFPFLDAGSFGGLPERRETDRHQAQATQ